MTIRYAIAILVVLIATNGNALGAERPAWLSTSDGDHLGLQFEHCLTTYSRSRLPKRTVAGMLTRGAIGLGTGTLIGDLIPQVGPTLGAAGGWFVGAVLVNAAVAAHDSERRSRRALGHRMRCRSKIALTAVADYEGQDVIAAKRQVEKYLEHWRRR